MSQKPTRSRTVALAVLTMCVGFLAGAGPAMANPSLGPPASFTSPVTVGDTNVPATIQVQNVSSAPENAGTVTLTELKLVPSCRTSFGAFPDNDCPAGQFEPGVFALSTTGIGTQGACAGQQFNIQPSSGSGQVRFVPVGPAVVLTQPGTPNDICVIAFTFDVLKTPVVDVGGAPGVQTFNLTYATGTPSVNPNNLQATGTTNGVVTVLPRPEIQIVKSVTPLTRPEPGGNFTYDLLITNPGPIDIVITSLDDDVYGDLSDPDESVGAAEYV